MMKKKIPVNCYSDREDGFMTWSRDLRAKWFKPALTLMGSMGIRAGHITLLGLISGLAFCPLFVMEKYPWAFGLLLLHVLLDGLDGPLARHLGKAGDRGSFTDSVADQVVVSATAITLIYSGVAGTWAGGTYLFLYTVVVAFAMIRNALCAPYSWLFRPRFLVFAWLPVEIYLAPGTLNYVLWIATILLGIKSLTGFIAIRRRI